MATRNWTVNEMTRLHELGIVCDRRRREMHDAEVAMQRDCTAETDARYYDAVAALIEAERAYEALEAELNKPARS